MLGATLTVPESRVGTPVRREVLGTLAMTEATMQALWTLDESLAGLGMMSEASTVLGDARWEAGTARLRWWG